MWHWEKRGFTEFLQSLWHIFSPPGTANFYRIQLVRGKPVIAEKGSPFEVQEVGNFIIITTPQGITLEWDKGTRLYLKLKTEHQGQVSTRVIAIKQMVGKV